jgi:Uma2 family endonuclease
MSQPAISASALLNFDLIYSDGEPLDNEWHTEQIPLLKEVIRQAMAERGRRDFFVGGDMFVYYSVEQARDVAKGRPYFRGPDVFWVGGAKPAGLRKAWVAWEEEGRLPDVIVELLSPSTAEIDRTVKKDIYARNFRTAEYFLYEPETQTLEGFRLAGQTYRRWRPMTRDDSAASSSERLSGSGMASGRTRRRTGCGCSVLTGAWCRPRPRLSVNRPKPCVGEPRPNVSGLKRRRLSWRACVPCSKGVDSHSGGAGKALFGYAGALGTGTGSALIFSWR